MKLSRGTGSRVRLVSPNFGVRSVHVHEGQALWTAIQVGLGRHAQPVGTSRDPQFVIAHHDRAISRQHDAGRSHALRGGREARPQGRDIAADAFAFAEARRQRTHCPRTRASESRRHRRRRFGFRPLCRRRRRAGYLSGDLEIGRTHPTPKSKRADRDDNERRDQHASPQRDRSRRRSRRLRLRRPGRGRSERDRSWHRPSRNRNRTCDLRARRWRSGRRRCSPCPAVHRRLRAS
jgi:hypothetical protein